MIVRAALAALALALATTAAAADQPSRARAAAAGVKPGIVDVETARKLVDAGVRVVDVRTAEEFAQGHLPGAVNIPFDQIGKRLGEVGAPDEPVLLYCRSGRRSAAATETLRANGYRALYDLQRYELWADAEKKRAGQ
jgi:phage shock protein E